jgi:hypothetical protein
MIVLNPMGGSNQRVIEANGLRDYDVNYKFASYLGKYLQDKGESVQLTRSTSEAKTQIELDKFITYTAPAVTFHIKCLEDISSEPSGYTVECDKYSALAATVSSELTKWGATPVYPLGYKVQTKNISAQYTEIIIGLGYITNSSDAAYLASDTKLESLALSIVNSAYGPPTKVMQPNDNVFVADPYMYDSSKWEEQADTKSVGDVSSIIDTTIENIPSKVFRFVTVDDSRVVPYTQSTAVTITDTSKSYILIISAKSGKTGSKAYVRVGNNIDEQVFVDQSWHKITIDYVDGDKVYIGTYGNSIVEFTALWLTPTGSMGSLDDPLKQYSIFPPGYRPIKSIDPTAVSTALIPSVITQANTLIGRAQDTKLPSINSGLQEILSKVDLLPISPNALVSSMQGIANQIKSVSLTSINVLDPIKVIAGVNYAGLEGMLKSMARADKKSALQKSVNDMKGVELAATQLLQTHADKLKRAEAQAEVLRKRAEIKGEAMSKA